MAPADFPQHILRYRNQRAAQTVGLGGLSDTEWLDHFGRFHPLEGSFPKPLALRYHGHQFQNYNPDLGDGRGFLFAQLLDEKDRLLDLATKGSGQTPWSRQGDGRLTLKGGVREVLATTMLEALGVDTSKSFSLIETGESLHRGDEPSPTRSAVLVRLSHSHIRIGTFQRQAHLQDVDALSRLTAHVIEHYYPDCARETMAASAAALLEAVCARVAETGAKWIAAGFVHGVLNTDNINLTGESFDYGPWRFLPHYDPGFAAAYFDQTGLYAFGRQPDVLAWNLTRLAECLLPLGEQADLERALNTYFPAFQRALPTAFLARLGLVSEGAEADAALLETLFKFMASSKAPYEQVLFDWRGGMESAARAAKSPIAELYQSDAFAPVRARLVAFTPAPRLNLDNSYFKRAQPRTMLIDEVEAIWAPIAADDDWCGFEKALTEIADMGRAYGHMP
ncbi:protein adenylyltransferase SelO family protein [Mariluticola halotolerans]|uniref:protein adenylyltransferase SelO family protein n=1 Tax=Mariluticola halotolerans TaxID=2909283 RepID=UPI0026E1E385|nr:YdiU family protein [Mariluticola halotolerans]UJQ94327.1 YdiU family protein [Mariluticola halotolerans]